MPDDLRRPPAGVSLFDPVDAWDHLHPDQQAAIGSAAIIYAFGLQGMDAGPSTGQLMWDSSAAAAAAAMKGDQLVIQAVANALPNRFVTIHAHNGAEYPFPLSMPSLAAVGVKQCRECGCIDEVACPEGCEWVADETPPLCSGCGERGDSDD